jgi:uncharacterized RDD family membrane protein YckC
MTAAPREVTTVPAVSGEDLGLRGHYSGFVSRFVGYVVDLGVSTGIFLLVLAAASFAASLVTGHSVNWSRGNIGVAIALAVWEFVYYAYSWAAAGKTFGMALLGVRVVRRDGADVDVPHAIIRTLAFPLSFLLCGLGFVGIVVGRERRALHDVIADTAVVYTWDARAQRLRFLARETPARMPREPARRAGVSAAQPHANVSIPAQARADVTAPIEAGADVPAPAQPTADVPVPARARADLSVWAKATADATADAGANAGVPVPAQKGSPERDAAPPGQLTERQRRSPRRGQPRGGDRFLLLSAAGMARDILGVADASGCVPGCRISHQCTHLMP